MNSITQTLYIAKNNRFQGTNYYVKSSNIGNIEMTNEIKYTNLSSKRKLSLIGIFKF
jgi:hypothetical protein